MTMTTTPQSAEINRRLGRRVRNLMFGKITQSELAQRIGTDQSGMSRRIHGKTDFSPYELVITAQMLDTTVDALLSEGHPSDYKAAVSYASTARKTRPTNRNGNSGPKNRR